MNVVFAGPTIRHSQVREYLDCVCLPPAGYGAVLDVLEQSPDAIGIIDGYFEGVPSVWHKEILYAMDQGVRVYGSASMGALRAAELCAFGMIGVGQIFEGYRDALLEDDDEVAVVHGPEEAGYIAASVPMVNIRATLAAACDQDVITECQQQALVRHSKNTFYKERSWNTLLRACDELFVETSTREQLAIWLSEHKVDQKRHDAIQMLQLMNEEQSVISRQDDKPFHFQWTGVWDVAVREHQQLLIRNRSLGEDDRKVIDQLRLNPDLYQQYSDKALLSCACKHTVETQVDKQMVKRSLDNFRADNKLHSRTQLLDYMDKAALDESSLTSLVTDVARVEFVRQAAGDLQPEIINQLKMDGRYTRLLESAVLKEAVLKTAQADATCADVPLPQVLDWYFEQQRGGSRPEELQPLLNTIDIIDTKDFYRLITQEYLYWHYSG